ncbi:MAG: hypothetical protein ACKVW3_13355 [Phycisphaerales bacterium]
MLFTLANVAILWVTRLTPAALFAFIPIVEIEARVLRRYAGTPIFTARWRLCLANFVTTLLGLPILWFAGLVVGDLAVPKGATGEDIPVLAKTLNNTIYETLSGLAFYPSEPYVRLPWFLGALAAFLSAACAISIVIERVLLGVLAGHEAHASRGLWKACLVGNLLSYAFLAAVAPFLVHAPVVLLPEWLMDLVYRAHRAIVGDI